MTIFYILILPNTQYIKYTYIIFLIIIIYFILFYGYIVGILLSAVWLYFITTLGKRIIYVIINLDNIVNIILNSDILSW